MSLDRVDLLQGACYFVARGNVKEVEYYVEKHNLVEGHTMLIVEGAAHTREPACPFLYLLMMLLV